MKVKSESELAQSCLTVCHTMDYSLPGSSVHGIFQARVPALQVPLPSLDACEGREFLYLPVNFVGNLQLL